MLDRNSCSSSKFLWQLYKKFFKLDELEEEYLTYQSMEESGIL